MAQYELFFTQVASTSVTVEADDLDAALDVAFEEIPHDVCGQCAGWGNRPGIELGGDWEFQNSWYYVDGEEVRGVSA